MSDTPEGIGSLKFSLLRENGVLKLMLGKEPLAALSPLGEKHMLLLVTAPQLWDATKDLVSSLQIAQAGNLSPTSQRVANVLAKAAGKNEWKDVKL